MLSPEEKLTAVTIERDSLRENFVRAVERNERLRAALEEIINYMETPDYMREIACRALEGAAVKAPRQHWLYLGERDIGGGFSDGQSGHLSQQSVNEHEHKDEHGDMAGELERTRSRPPSNWRTPNWRIFRLIGLWFDAKESELRQRADRSRQEK